MDPRWPARPATAADYAHFVRFFAELGVPDPVPDPARWEADMLPQTLFLEHEGAPIAYAMVRPLGPAAHVVHVVVDAPWRGRRVGGALMEAVVDRLRALGCTRLWLNVKADNAPALRLYERCGLRRAYRSTALTLPWADVAALPREATPLAARTVDPSEDAALESAFPRLAGRLAASRQRAGFVLVRLVDPARTDDAKLGVAAFDPAFPGASPFMVARPALAAPLLDALRAHARPGDTYLRLTAEDDEPLARALVAAGATVTFELLNMERDLGGPAQPAAHAEGVGVCVQYASTQLV
jgi:GNAT superfamily N-acetyltransferase